MAGKLAVGPCTHTRSPSALRVVRVAQGVTHVRRAAGAADGLSAMWAESSPNPWPEPAALGCERALARIDRTLDWRARVIGRLSSAALWLAGPPLATAEPTARIILLWLAIVVGSLAILAWDIWIFWYAIKYGEKKQKLLMPLTFVTSFILAFLIAVALSAPMWLSGIIGYSIALIIASCYYFAAVR